MSRRQRETPLPLGVEMVAVNHYAGEWTLRWVRVVRDDFPERSVKVELVKPREKGPDDVRDPEYQFFVHTSADRIFTSVVKARAYIHKRMMGDIRNIRRQIERNRTADPF